MSIYQVIPTWELLVTSRLSGGKEIGPLLETLPEELLPALTKFLFIGKDVTEQVWTRLNDNWTCTFVVHFHLIHCRGT